MKTKLLFKITLLALLLSITIPLSAQDKDDDASAQLSNAFKEMHATAKLKLKNLPCDVENVAQNFKPVLGKYTFSYTLNYVKDNIKRMNDSLEGLVPKGDFSTKFDRMFEMFDASKSYSEFVSDVANRGVGDLSKSEDKSLKNVHRFLKIIHNRGNLTFHDGYAIKGCDDYTEYQIKIKNKNLGNITWEIRSVVEIDCKCNKASKTDDIESLKFEYTAEVTGLFTAKKMTFGKAKNANLKIISYQCCPEKEEKKEEPTETALNDDEGIEDLMPDQTIGFGAGIGFGQDFEETTWCVTAEYLYQINADEYKGWYVGGEVTHSNTSFGDFSSNRTLAGGKIQYNISAVPSGETQFVAGLMANYGFGNTDNNGFKDDFTGTIFCAYGGANIRVCEDWSIGLQFPILIFENFTFKPESGGEFKTDATSLFINKDNPLKIVIRRRL